ncbi:MAG: hypothetical protein QOH50_5053 [Kribbellaceae bacterium]|nr:hypothetical protein [Kribbellaceae bacterium]
MYGFDRAAKRYSRKAIGNMHQALHKEMNLHCLTFDFHADEDGKMRLIWYVLAIYALIRSSNILKP